MGTLGEGYTCPWCYRVDSIDGPQSYAPDGIDYPICTEGSSSCLWYWEMAVNGVAKNSLALHYILRQRLGVEICVNIWEFCGCHTTRATEKTVNTVAKNGWALHYVLKKKIVDEKIVFDVGTCMRVWELYGHKVRKPGQRTVVHEDNHVPSKRQRLL